MKYIIKNSDLFLNGKLIAEGTEIDLAEEQIKGLEDYLIPLNNDSKVPEGHPVQVYAEHSRSIEGQKKLNTKGNKK